jgi:hypothetical protein
MRCLSLADSLSAEGAGLWAFGWTDLQMIAVDGM